MPDLTTIHAELSGDHDLTPSVDLARDMADINVRMDRMMVLPHCAMAAPYVAAMNRLKAKRGRWFWRKAT